LSEDERIDLVPKMKRRTHREGDILVQQGSIAKALSIVGSGALIAVQKHEGSEVEALRLAPGDSFGEAGVLIGAATMFEIRALTKATVYEIAKDDLAAILTRRPAIVAELGEVLAKRQAVGKAHLEEFAAPDRPGETLASQLSHRVKALFGIA
jgi:CRP-like cAMP-binding protein